MKKSYLGQRWLMIPIKQAINSWSPRDQRGTAGLKSPSSSSQSVRVLCGSIRRGAGLTSICPLVPLQPQVCAVPSCQVWLRISHRNWRVIGSQEQKRWWWSHGALSRSYYIILYPMRHYFMRYYLRALGHLQQRLVSSRNSGLGSP